MEADTFKAALDRAWFLMLLQTSVRSAELLDVRLGDLDFSYGRFFVSSGKMGTSVLFISHPRSRLPWLAIWLIGLIALTTISGFWLMDVSCKRRSLAIV